MKAIKICARGERHTLSKYVLFIGLILLSPWNSYAQDCSIIPCCNPPFEGDVEGGGAVFLCRADQIYSVNARTGVTTIVTTSPLANAINSMGSVVEDGLVYYASHTTGANNKQLYAWNYITNTHIEIDFDSTTPGIQNDISLLGIPLSSAGLGSGGASFYNDHFYIGVEYIGLSEDAVVYSLEVEPGSNGRAFRSATEALNLGPMSVNNFGDISVLNDFILLYSNSQNDRIEEWNMNTGAMLTSVFIGPGQLASDGNSQYFCANYVQSFDASTLVVSPDSVGPIQLPWDAAACVPSCVIGKLVWEDEDL
jgi:hypothetical protein